MFVFRRWNLQIHPPDVDQLNKSFIYSFKADLKGGLNDKR